MTPPDLAAVRTELARCRHTIDLALGRALQLLDVLENEWREQQRDSRLTAGELTTLGWPP